MLTALGRGHMKIAGLMRGRMEIADIFAMLQVLVLPPDPVFFNRGISVEKHEIRRQHQHLLMAKMSAICIRPRREAAIFICPRPKAVSMGNPSCLR